MNIRQLAPQDYEKLTDFFKDISNNSVIKKFFHPHPLTEEYARELCLKIDKMKDLYFIAEEEKIIGYAMLRGWEEGYDIPSFGICVHPNYQGQGIGKDLTDFAIKLCKEKKAPKMMLKVYKYNKVAFNLYKKVGFNFTGETEDKKQWIGYLEIKK